MKQFKDYLGTKTAVHCSTIEGNFQISFLLKKEGYKIYDSYWEEYEENTCYCLTNKWIQFANVDWFEEHGYTIMPASEFLSVNTTKTMKYTFKNGATFEGNVEDLKIVAKALGESITPVYKSTTHGEIPVDEMNTVHLKNAILKQLREFFVQSSFKGLGHQEFLDKIDGLDETTNILLTELKSRV